MKRLGLYMTISVLIFSGNAWAGQWQIVGPRAMGMGGAYVAVVNDATAQYWNPAAFGFFNREKDQLERDKKDILEIDEKKDIEKEKTESVSNEKKDTEKAKSDKSDKEKKEPLENKSSKLWTGYSDRYFGLHLNVGVGVQFLDDLVDEMDNLNDVMDDVDFDNLEDSSADGTLPVDKIADALKLYASLEEIVDSDLAVIAMGNANLGLRFGHFGIGYYGFSEIAGSANIDLSNLSFAGSSGVNDMINDWYSQIPAGASQKALNDSQKDQIRPILERIVDTGMANKLIEAIDYALTEEGYDKSNNQVPENLFQAAINLAESISAGGGTGSLAIASASSGLNLDKNESSITFIGALISEVPVTYGYAFNDYLAIGGNLKLMQGKVYYKKINLFEQSEEGNPFANAYDDVRTSYSYGIDMGIMGRIPMFRLGMVARNINRPTFSIDRDSGFKHFWVDPQVRAGVAFVPNGWFTLAMDMDVTRNESVTKGYDSRLLSGGMEFNIYNFLMLRAGGYTNVGDDTDHDKFVVTAGLGINLWLIRWDLGIAASTDRQKFDDDSIPSEMRGQTALSVLF